MCVCAVWVHDVTEMPKGRCDEHKQQQTALSSPKPYHSHLIHAEHDDDHDGAHQDEGEALVVCQLECLTRDLELSEGPAITGTGYNDQVRPYNEQKGLAKHIAPFITRDEC